MKGDFENISKMSPTCNLKIPIVGRHVISTSKPVGLAVIFGESTSEFSSPQMIRDYARVVKPASIAAKATAII